MKRFALITNILIFFVLVNYSCKKEQRQSLPELSTIEVTTIGATSFKSGGNISNDGGDMIISRGICWSTNSNPTISDNKTSDGTGTGIYPSSAVGLIPSKKYYVRAYATNSFGTGYGNVFTFSTSGEETLREDIHAYPGVEGEVVTTTINGHEVKCKKINEILFFQGDIVISPELKAASLDNKKYIWPNNTLIYTISSNFPNSNRITESFKEFNKTNIVFKERTNENNYVEFKYIKDAGCYSEAGMQGRLQNIVIDTWGDPATIAHEIGHALGLIHEQSKSTRDQYINILEQNIIPDEGHNFEIYYLSRNTPGFDFNSLMLYSSYAFSIRPGVLPTITKKDGSTFTAQRQHFSDADISLINQLYPSKPEVITSLISEITSSTAIGGGTINSDKGSEVIERGICWSTFNNPTIENSKTIDGKEIGKFTSNLTGLQPNATYYVRAYATNSVGTAYGNEVSFTTKQTGTAPVADFIVSSTSTSIGQSIQFTDKSTNTPTSWLWSFGDGTTSTSQNSNYIYNTAGTYTVSLKVSNSYGSNIKMLTNYITITQIGTAPVANFEASSTSVIIDQSIQFTDKSINNPTSWFWDFGDGTTSNQQNPTKTYSAVGTYTISLKTTNSYGNNTKSISIIVNNLGDTTSSFTDPRDGQIYKTVKIGNQTWMAENLNYLPYVTPFGTQSSSTPCYYVYDRNSYGVLYNWPAAQNASPNGWHIPSIEEWDELEKYLIENGYNYDGSTKENKIAKSIASKSGWVICDYKGAPCNDPQANNKTGFSGVPSGTYGKWTSFDGSCEGWTICNIGRSCTWWSSTPDGDSNYYGRGLYEHERLWHQSLILGGGYSIRCIKD